MARSSRPRLQSLDGLRGLAAVAVMCLHVWMYTDANYPAPGRTDLLDRAMGELRLGLIFFFVLSGYLLSLPWLSGRAPELARYALRRIARIGPGYWVAMLGTLALLHGTGHGRDIPLHDLPKFVFFVSNVFEDTRSKLDPPMWSLHIEATFYIVLPLIGLALLRARRTLLVPLALIAAGLVWTTVSALREWAPETTWTLPTYLGAFACGIAAASLKPKGGVTPFVCGALGVAAVAADAAWHSMGTGTLGHAIGDLPAAAGFAAIVWAVAARPSRALGSWPLRQLGTVSYGVYLWHYPVMYALQLHAQFPERFLPAMARVAPITLALALVSWFAVERPAINWSARVTARRRTARPAAAAAES